MNKGFKMMKKIIGTTMLVVIGLTGCSSNNNKKSFTATPEYIECKEIKKDINWFYGHRDVGDLMDKFAKKDCDRILGNF